MTVFAPNVVTDLQLAYYQCFTELFERPCTVSCTICDRIERDEFSRAWLLGGNCSVNDSLIMVDFINRARNALTGPATRSVARRTAVRARWPTSIK